MIRILILIFCFSLFFANIFSQTKTKSGKMENQKINKSNEEWKKILSDTEYKILREKGTERAFSGKYWNFYDAGTYYCAACDNPLFKSDAKFKSSCGWPSYFEPINPKSVEYHEDLSYGMHRVEVTCGKCGSHLGHIFDDGPKPTGKRYCINSIAIKFRINGEKN